MAHALVVTTRVLLCVDLGEKHKTKTLISSSSVVINIHRSLPRRISLSTAGPCSLMPPPLPAVPLYKPCTTTGHAPVHYLRIPAYLLRPLPYGPCPCPLSPPMPLLARPTVHYLRIPAPPPSLRAMPLSVHVSLCAHAPAPYLRIVFRLAASYSQPYRHLLHPHNPAAIRLVKSYVCSAPCILHFYLHRAFGRQWSIPTRRNKRIRAMPLYRSSSTTRTRRKIQSRWLLLRARPLYRRRLYQQHHHHLRTAAAHGKFPSCCHELQRDQVRQAAHGRSPEARHRKQPRSQTGMVTRQSLRAQPTTRAMQLR